MPKLQTPPADPNRAAVAILRHATGIAKEPTTAERPPKNRAAVLLGRKGGKVGGKARAEKLTAERRSKIASDAARKRWGVKPTDNVE